MMTHEKFTEFAGWMRRNDRVSEWELEAAAEHMASDCPDCKRELETERRSPEEEKADFQETWAVLQARLLPRSLD